MPKEEQQKQPKKPIEPQRKEFIIRVEGLIPAVVEYKVMAYTEDDAYKTFDKDPYLLNLVSPPKILPGKIIKKKISIRSSFSTLITWMKQF